MRKSENFSLLRAIFIVILIATAFLGFSGRSSAQAINPVQQRFPLPGSPIGAITTGDGRYVFVSTTDPTQAVIVLRQRETFAAVMQTIHSCGPAFGLAMSKGDKYLLVAVQSGKSCPSAGAQFIDVLKAIAGDPGAAMGTVPTDPSAIEVAISPDNRLVFDANEFCGGKGCDNQDSVSVIDFHQALLSNQSQSSVIGAIPVDCAPVGLALSSDSRHLYVTNELAFPTEPFYDPSACNIPDGSGCPIQAHQGPVGTLDIIDVGSARPDPMNSVVANIRAGCSPTRVILTNKDKVTWVSARDDNNLLAFNTADLLANPSAALMSTTPVGIAPDGALPFFESALHGRGKHESIRSMPRCRRHGQHSRLQFGAPRRWQRRDGWNF